MNTKEIDAQREALRKKVYHYHLLRDEEEYKKALAELNSFDEKYPCDNPLKTLLYY